jgi:nucleotide-binding universal stress UspA family protein
MKNILLVTDLAIQTNRAFERAIKLATTLAAKFHILHVS